MNKEKYNQIIDEAYNNYLKGGDTKWLKQIEVDTPAGKMNIPIPYTQEEFINKCKTDQEFSERWGLKIEERGLSYDERMKILINNGTGWNIIECINRGHEYMNEENIPTKLITIIYNNEKIEIYE